MNDPSFAPSSPQIFSIQLTHQEAPYATCFDNRRRRYSTNSIPSVGSERVSEHYQAQEEDKIWNRCTCSCHTRPQLVTCQTEIELALESNLPPGDWEDGLRAMPPPFWVARYSSATTMSPISGRKLGCSWRHIAVMAIAWWRQRTGKCPCSRGSAKWANFLRSFRYGLDCKVKKREKRING